MFFLDFLLIFTSSTPTKPCKNLGFFNVFPKSLFSKIIRKIAEKSSKNPFKIDPKSMKNRKISLQNTTSSKDAQKMRIKCEKMRKMSPTWPQHSPKRRGLIFAGGLRVPLPADHLSWENASKSLGVQDASRRGEDPRALRPLRGDRRHPWRRSC